MTFNPDTQTQPDDLIDAIVAFVGAQKIAGKRATDAGDRVRLDTVNGAVYVGNGTTTPTAGVRALGASSSEILGGFYMPTTGTAPGAVAGRGRAKSPCVSGGVTLRVLHTFTCLWSI